LTLARKAILAAPVNPRDASLSLETETGFFPMNARATADCTRRASFFKRNTERLEAPQWTRARRTRCSARSAPGEARARTAEADR
jgi:hypothetical protein